jgi:PPOX class probable F420-dependent enzyme
VSHRFGYEKKCRSGRGSPSRGRGYSPRMARKDISLTDEELAAFLESGHTLQVATIGADGYPHLAPMWYVVRDGAIVFRSFTKSQKIFNLQRNPKLSVLVETGSAYHELRGAMIRGTARLVTDRQFVLDVYGALAAKYEMIGGHQVRLDGAALEAAFGRFADKNTAVIVEPDKIATWDHAKLGGAY